MLLAGDVGGTKTLIGLFSRGAARPAPASIRTYRTLDFPDLGTLALEFLRGIGADARAVESACFGVAGPVRGGRAQLTNVPWIVEAAAVGRTLGIPRTDLLNDLESLAWSVSVLEPDEIAVLQQGQPDESGNAALLAAGTGLGVAFLPRVRGQFLPRASEGGHVDFAARDGRERTLQDHLVREFGRAELERVVSGPGLGHIHRFLHPHQCATLSPLPGPDALPPLISRAALEAGCPDCLKTLNVFVSAYGSAAGDLALSALATGGLYLGGGIAPRILPALGWPIFLDAFRAKAPMEALMARIPVKVILNAQAGLVGAAMFAQNQLEC